MDWGRSVQAAATSEDEIRPGSIGRPLVSIGLPVLNGEQFLSEALDSLLDQDCTDFELLISDNASTDETGRIAQRYAARDPRVRYVRHARRRGASFNFNHTVGSARGKYFKWAAHDDVCASGFLSRCLEVLERDPGVVLCYPRALEIDPDGAVTRAFPPAAYAREERPSERVRSFLTLRPPCLEAYGVMRRDVLLDTRMIGPFVTADGVFLLEMMLRGRFAQVGSFEFRCRTHPERSIARNRLERRRWYADSASGGPGFPQWRLTAELVRSIVSAPIDGGERTRCLAQVARWAVRNAQPHARDVAAAGKFLVRRSGERVGLLAGRVRSAPGEVGS